MITALLIILDEDDSKIILAITVGRKQQVDKAYEQVGKYGSAND